MNLKASFLTALFICVLPVTDQSTGWRGVSPLHSSCEDVKRVLGVQTCTYPASKYEFEKYYVKVSFSTGETCLKDPLAWKVPKGTVLSVTVSPKVQMSLSDFGLQLGDFK